MSATGAALPTVLATYVYAVCRRLDPAVLTDLPGLTEESPVRTLRFGALTAVVQDVQAALFTEEAWQRRLSDVSELERCARGHHHVVTAVAANGPTVPLALATIFHGDERALQSLVQDSNRFEASLRRVEGRVEWAVKVYVPTAPSQPSSPAAPPAERSCPAPGAGRAYLDRKRGVQKRREERYQESLRTADTADRALSALSADSRRLRAHAPVAADARRRQVLNAAYLVAEDRAPEFLEAVRSLREVTGADIEMSGPWVPYSFAGEVSHP